MQAPTNVKLVINFMTGKALCLTILPTLAAHTDEAVGTE